MVGAGWGLGLGAGYCGLELWDLSLIESGEGKGKERRMRRRRTGDDRMGEGGREDAWDPDAGAGTGMMGGWYE